MCKVTARHTPKWALKEEREHEAGNPGPNNRINGKQPPAPTKREKRAPEKDICEGENKSRRKEELDVAWDEGSQGEESEEEPGMPTIVSDSDETEEDHEEDTEEDSEEDSDEESVMPKLWYKRARARCRRESAYEEEGETGAVKTQKLPTGGAQSCDPSQPDAERSDDSSRCQQQQREESRKQEKPSEEVKRKRELDQQEETVKRRGKPGGKAVGIQTASKKCSHAKEEHPIEQDEAERIKGALEENWDTIRIETINVTSLITNGWIALRRKSHVQLLQETCISVYHARRTLKESGRRSKEGPLIQSTAGHQLELERWPMKA